MSDDTEDCGHCSDYPEGWPCCYCGKDPGKSAGVPWNARRLPGRCSCGNDFDGDNLCMVSACQWEE